MGRPEAYAIVDDVAGRAAREGISLQDAAASDERIRAVLSLEELARVLDPAAYLGSANAFIDRALEGHRSLRASVGAAAR
jgi:3-carboxy-cis,cis-muconate cycloisomerase